MQEKREKRRLQQQELREKRAQVSIFSSTGNCMSAREICKIVVFSLLIIFMNCDNFEIKRFHSVYRFDNYFGRIDLITTTLDGFPPLFLPTEMIAFNCCLAACSSENNYWWQQLFLRESVFLTITNLLTFREVCYSTGGNTILLWSLMCYRYFWGSNFNSNF